MIVHVYFNVDSSNARVSRDSIVTLTLHGDGTDSSDSGDSSDGRDGRDSCNGRDSSDSGDSEYRYLLRNYYSIIDIIILYIHL